MASAQAIVGRQAGFPRGLARRWRMNRSLQLAAAFANTLATGATAASPPDAAWISQAQDPSLRSPNGCPASFISRDGLVLASRQCVSACIHSLSTAGTDYVRDGFYAAARSEERRCPAMGLDRLERGIYEDGRPV